MPRSKLSSELLGIQTELEPLQRATETAFADLAAYAHPLLASMAPAMGKVRGVGLVSRRSSIEVSGDPVVLSNGAKLTSAWASSGRSMVHRWTQTASHAGILMEREDFDGAPCPRAVSTDGIVFGPSPETAFNPCQRPPGDYFYVAGYRTPDELRRRYATCYAGSVAMASLVAEGLEVGFGIKYDRSGFGNLYDSWMGDDVSDAPGINWPAARFLGAEIIDDVAQRPPTLPAM